MPAMLSPKTRIGNRGGFGKLQDGLFVINYLIRTPRFQIASFVDDVYGVIKG